MAQTTDDQVWRGTSDARSTARSREASTATQRWAWLEGSMQFAAASGALDRVRSGRQQEADDWWSRRPGADDHSA